MTARAGSRSCRRRAPRAAYRSGCPSSLVPPLSHGRRGADQGRDAAHALGQLAELGAEREARVASEAGMAVAAPLAGIDVEETARDADDALLEGGPEEAHPVVERRRQRGEVGPAIERALRLEVEPHPRLAQTRQQDLALAQERVADRRGLGRDDGRV